MINTARKLSSNAQGTAKSKIVNMISFFISSSLVLEVLGNNKPTDLLPDKALDVSRVALIRPSYHL